MYIDIKVYSLCTFAMEDAISKSYKVYAKNTFYMKC